MAIGNRAIPARKLGASYGAYPSPWLFPFSKLASGPGNHCCGPRSSTPQSPWSGAHSPQGQIRGSAVPSAVGVPLSSAREPGCTSAIPTAARPFAAGDIGRNPFFSRSARTFRSRISARGPTATPSASSRTMISRSASTSHSARCLRVASGFRSWSTSGQFCTRGRRSRTPSSRPFRSPAAQPPAISPARSRARSRGRFPRLRRCRTDSRQRLLDVADQVVDVLDADRQAHEIGRTQRPRPFDARAMLGQAFDRPQRGRALEHPELRREAISRRSSPPARRSDIIPPNPPCICFAAIACPGCDGKPG